MNTPVLRNLALLAALTIPLPATFGAAFHEDFTDGLGAYTAAIVGGGDRELISEWETVDGALRINSSETDPDDSARGVHHFLTRNDARLEAGYEWRVSVSPDFTGEHGLGIAVGSDYASRGEGFIFIQTDGDRILSRGINPGAGFGRATTDSGEKFDSLFIARIDENVFEVGYYDGEMRTVIATREMSSPDVGHAFGFYADVQSAGVMGAITSATLHRLDMGTLLELSQVRIGGAPGLWNPETGKDVVVGSNY